MSNNTAFPPNNGAVLKISKIIKAVMSSASEAELGALFTNCKEYNPELQDLGKIGHKQPPTPMQTDNTTAQGVVTINIESKRLNLMDRRLHWIQCRGTQGQF